MCILVVKEITQKPTSNIIEESEKNKKKIIKTLIDRTPVDTWRGRTVFHSVLKFNVKKSLEI